MPQIKVGYILAADGKTRLNYRLTLPPDLDETKKYPTIVYIMEARMPNWLRATGKTGLVAGISIWHKEVM